MAERERRANQRLKLAKPILGSTDGGGALVLDVGMAGALIEHYGACERGDRFTLRFPWRGTPIEFVCEVARSEQVRVASGGSPVCHTGVRFVHPVADAEEQLEAMITASIGEIFETQRANADGSSTSAGPQLLHLGDALRARTHGFITMRYADGGWSQAHSQLPLQPPNGFTVAAYEEEEQVRLLCATYEASDAAGRDLIRMLAELSTRSARRLA